jgi:ribonucleotide reductase beta subunit family protein with ferritin-like domain
MYSHHREAPVAAQVAITFVDEAPGAQRREALRITLWSERVTARELIERRVRHEVEIYNRTTPEIFQGLVQPTDAEQILNGWRMNTPRLLDAERQIARALDAFRHNRILLLVDDRQVETLDEEVLLTRDAEVCFYKLLPLVGG